MPDDRSPTPDAREPADGVDAGAAGGAAGSAAGGAAGGAPPPTAERERAVAGPRRTPVTQHIGRAASLAIAVLFGIFAVSNAQYVDFNWVFGGTEVVEQAGERVSGGVRLIVLMVGSFLAGLVVATMDAWRRTRRRRRQPPTS